MSTGEPPRLADIAHGRSGDKGDHANVAVIAYTPQGYAWLREYLTADVVRRYFEPLGPSRVVRYGGDGGSARARTGRAGATPTPGDVWRLASAAVTGRRTSLARPPCSWMRLVLR